MNRAVWVGWVARAVAIAMQLVNTRLLVELTGVAGLAAHAIIASLLAWFTLLSFGLPAGNQNLTAEWRAKGRPVNDLRDTVASLATLLLLLSTPVAVVLAIVLRQYLLVGYPFVATWAVIVACLLMLVAALGTIFSQMLHAERRSIWPNVFPALAALATGGLLLVLRVAGSTDFNLVLVASFVPAAAIVGLALHQLGLPRRWLLERACITALWQRSRGYLLAAFLGTVTLGVDYLILSRVLDENGLAAYNLAGRFFLVLISVHAVVLASAWTPMSELFYAGDFARLRRQIGQVLGIGMLVALAGGGIVLLFLPELVALLAGDAAPAVPTTLAVLWFAYLLVRLWSDSFFAVLQSFGRTDLLNRYIPFQALISASAQIYLGSHFGAEGVLAGMLLSFMLTCVWYLPKHSWRLTATSSRSSKAALNATAR